MFLASRSPRRLAALVVLAVVPAAWSQETARPGRVVEPLVDVKLADESTMKLRLSDDRFDLETKFGKLTIPLAEVRKIEFGFRVTDEMAKQIAEAVANLGSSQYRVREEAGQSLFALQEKAYPALQKAAQSTDPEIVKRAEEIMAKIKALVPEGKLNVPDYDTVTTDDSKFTGKILRHEFKAKSFTFGEVTLKLADASAMTVVGTLGEKELAAALPDPGALTALQREVGKTYLFKVTGASAGTLWGTETYTLDSPLAAAAVHMGLVKAGQTGYVKVTVLGSWANFTGSTRNGLTSSSYQNYPGAYKIARAD
jgi:hypothetical protein